MKYWKNIVIVLCLIGIGVLIAKLFQKETPAVTSVQPSIDSLVSVNVSSQVKHRKILDSLDGIIRAKDEINVTLAKKVEYISQKYAVLRAQEHPVDTIINTDFFFDCSEALEKMPVLVAQLGNCQSENQVWSEISMKKTEQNIALQGQFDRAMVLNNDQSETIKKLDKKRKANKRLALISASVVLILGVVAAVK